MSWPGITFCITGHWWIHFTIIKAFKIINNPTISSTACWERTLMLHITCFLWRESTGDQWFPLQKDILLALCEGNPPVTGGFPSQRASNKEGVSTSQHPDGSSSSIMVHLNGNRELQLNEVLSWNPWLLGKFIILLHWGLNKMADALQSTFSNTFSWQKMIVFWFKLDWGLSLEGHPHHLYSERGRSVKLNDFDISHPCCIEIDSDSWPFSILISACFLAVVAQGLSPWEKM